MIILVASSFVAALLMDFNFVSPDGTVQEDLSYLTDHLENQKISSWAWLATSMTTFLTIPLYLMAFHKRLKVLHYLNALLLLGASAGFLLMGLQGLEMNQGIALSMTEEMAQSDESTSIGLLRQFNTELFYRRIGSSFIGLLAIGLGLSRIRVHGFPIFSTVILLICGPAMIFLNWYDPDHLLRTVAMAGIIIGVAVLSVRLINRGM